MNFFEDVKIKKEPIEDEIDSHFDIEVEEKCIKVEVADRENAWKAELEACRTKIKEEITDKCHPESEHNWIKDEIKQENTNLKENDFNDKLSHSEMLEDIHTDEKELEYDCSKNQVSEKCDKHVKTQKKAKTVGCKKKVNKRLNNRNKLAHKEEKPFECQVCNMKFRCKAFLDNHSFRHTVECQIIDGEPNSIYFKLAQNDEKLLNSDVRKKKCVEQETSQKHELAHIIQIWFRCNICNRRFKKEEKLKHHQCTQNKSSINQNETKLLFNCDACSMKFDTKEILEDHKLAHSIIVKIEQYDVPIENVELPLQIKASTESYKNDICDNIITVKKEIDCENEQQITKESVVDKQEPIQRLVNTRKKNNRNKMQVVIKKCLPTFVCKICKKKFISEKYFEKHKLDHTVIRPFKCNICERTYKSKKALIHHRPSHNVKTPLKCDICLKQFVRKKIFQKHKLAHMNDTRFECDVCKTKFVRQETLEYHRLSHVEEKPFECTLCKARFRYKAYLDDHNLSHIKLFECKVCKKQFENSFNLSNHERIHKDTFDCNICKKKFKSNSLLDEHKLAHKSEFVCNICKMSFNSEIDLESHGLAHKTLKKTYECDVCKEQFAKKELFEKHKLDLVHKRPFVCDVCNMRFFREEALVDHKLTHTLEKPFTCDTCQMQFRYSALLEHHLLTHVLPFECDICFKRFKRSETLAKHKSDQIGCKLFLCEICTMKFNTKSALEAHYLVHTGNKTAQSKTQHFA